MANTKSNGRKPRRAELQIVKRGAEPDGSGVQRERESSWPTPRTKGMCGGTGNFEQMKRLEAEGVITEAERKGMTAGNGGKLNPDWVELLMGWEKGWTKLDEKAKLWFESLRRMRRPSGKKALQRTVGGPEQLSSAPPLLADMREQPQGPETEKLPLAGAEAQEAVLRVVRPDGEAPCSPPGPEPDEQRSNKPTDTMHILPSVPTRHDGEAGGQLDPFAKNPWADGWEDGTPRVTNNCPYRVDRLRLTGNGVVSLQSVPAWEKIKRMAE